MKAAKAFLGRYSIEKSVHRLATCTVLFAQDLQLQVICKYASRASFSFECSLWWMPTMKKKSRLYSGLIIDRAHSTRVTIEAAVDALPMGASHLRLWVLVLVNACVNSPPSQFSFVSMQTQSAILLHRLWTALALQPWL